jgi:hypothetical protein
VSSPCGCHRGGAGRISRHRGSHRLARPARVVADVEPEAVSSWPSLAQASPYFWLFFWVYATVLLLCFWCSSPLSRCLHSAPRLLFVIDFPILCLAALNSQSAPSGTYGRRFLSCFRPDLEFLAVYCVHWPVYIMAAKLSDSHLLLCNSSFTTIQHFVISWFCALPSSLQFMIFSLPRFCALVLWWSLQFLTFCPALCVICPAVVRLLPCDCAL